MFKKEKWRKKWKVAEKGQKKADTLLISKIIQVTVIKCTACKQQVFQSYEVLGIM